MVSTLLQPIAVNASQLASLSNSASNTWSGTGPSAAEASRTAIEVPRSYSVTVQVELPERHPLRFRVPYLALNISDEDRDGVFVVTDTFSRVYGEGENDIAATKDYLSNLLDHFLDLEHHERILSPGLQRDLAQMRRYIIRIQ